MSGPTDSSEPSETSAPTSPREAGKQETRRALVEAALAEFREKGLDGPSLDAICARAGFTRGAFYVHFGGREDLLAAAMERALGLLLDAVVAGEGPAEGGAEAAASEGEAQAAARPAAGGGGRSELAGIVDRYVGLAAAGLRDLDEGKHAPPPLAAGVPMHQVMAACQRHEPTRQRMEDILAEAQRRLAGATRAGQRARSVRDDVGAGDVATLLLLLALGVRAAADLSLPLHVERTRDALLRVLAAGAHDGVRSEGSCS